MGFDAFLRGVVAMNNLRGSRVVEVCGYALFRHLILADRGRLRSKRGGRGCIALLDAGCSILCGTRVLDQQCTSIMRG